MLKCDRFLIRGGGRDSFGLEEIRAVGGLHFKCEEGRSRRDWKPLVEVGSAVCPKQQRMDGWTSNWNGVDCRHTICMKFSNCEWWTQKMEISSNP
ncbi:hypothetical protein AVEN_21044-1 [Araneus ventricosus]|uniref:Uncharacterized protein n=1 Tax=Araneus ventricosus TaxID=182803 RepID=A0A4Y2H258_ARAVE|nr:hypothetical protein AVEN_21044-1 [Araneus ventricosus]